MQTPPENPNDSPSRWSPGLIIWGGYPILALVLLVIALFGDVQPEGKPAILLFVGSVILVLTPFIFVAQGIAALFSRTIREKIRCHNRLQALWGIAALLILFFMIVPIQGSRFSGRAMRSAKTRNTLGQVSMAIVAYGVEYDNFPATSDNKTIIKILQGDNPRKIAFLNLQSHALTSSGEVTDAWGTPLRFSVTDPKQPLIRSAGPDKVWDTSDDFIATP